MADDRTGEQKDADENLREAVRRVIASRRVEHRPGEHLVLAQFVVLAAETGFDADGDDVTAIQYVTSYPYPPQHHQIGLVEYGRQHLRGWFEDGGEG